LLLPAIFAVIAFLLFAYFPLLLIAQERCHPVPKESEFYQREEAALWRNE